MGFADLLKRLVGSAPSLPIRTHLTSAQVIDVARRAAGDHWLRNSLNVATPQRGVTGAVFWIVETGGVGSFLRFVIDDASGEVLDRRGHNGR